MGRGKAEVRMGKDEKKSECRGGDNGVCRAREGKSGWG